MDNDGTMDNNALLLFFSRVSQEIQDHVASMVKLAEM